MNDFDKNSSHNWIYFVFKDKIGREKLFTDLNIVKMKQIIDDLMQSVDINETIRKMTSKMNLNQIIEHIIDSLNLDQMLEKMLNFEGTISYTKYLLELFQFNELIDHLQDPEWMFKWILPDIDKSGVDHLIEGFKNSLQAVVNGTTNIKDILINATLEKGIPYLIYLFEFENIIPNDIKNIQLNNRDSLSVCLEKFY